MDAHRGLDGSDAAGLAVKKPLPPLAGGAAQHRKLSEAGGSAASEPEAVSSPQGQPDAPVDMSGAASGSSEEAECVAEALHAPAAEAVRKGGVPAEEPAPGGKHCRQEGGLQGILEEEEVGDYDGEDYDVMSSDGSRVLSMRPASSGAPATPPLHAAPYKVSLCRYFVTEGGCQHGARCTFAHGDHELRSLSSGQPAAAAAAALSAATGGVAPVAKPHLVKTQLCRHFMRRGVCAHGDRCAFAHGDQDLRRTAPSEQRDRRVCAFWQEGNCKNGASCRFHHGYSDPHEGAGYASSTCSDLSQMSQPMWAPAGHHQMMLVPVPMSPAHSQHTSPSRHVGGGEQAPSQLEPTSSDASIAALLRATHPFERSMSLGGVSWREAGGDGTMSSCSSGLVERQHEGPLLAMAWPMAAAGGGHAMHMYPMHMQHQMLPHQVPPPPQQQQQQEQEQQQEQQQQPLPAPAQHQQQQQQQQAPAVAASLPVPLPVQPMPPAASPPPLCPAPAPAPVVVSASPDPATSSPDPASSSSSTAAMSADMLSLLQRRISSLLCPLTQQPFEEPVLAADGHIYERHAIETWLYKDGHPTSPVTREPLPHKMLMPCPTMRRCTEEVLALVTSMRQQVL